MKPILTRDEAKLEAEKRWGGIAYVRDRGVGTALSPRYVVGVFAKKSGNVLVHGEGTTWELAFLDADGRAEFLKPYMIDRNLP